MSDSITPKTLMAKAICRMMTGKDAAPSVVGFVFSSSGSTAIDVAGISSLDSIGSIFNIYMAPMVSVISGSAGTSVKCHAATAKSTASSDYYRPSGTKMTSGSFVYCAVMLDRDNNVVAVKDLRTSGRPRQVPSDCDISVSWTLKFN